VMAVTTLEEFTYVSFCLCLTFILQIWFVSFINQAMIDSSIMSNQRRSEFLALDGYMMRRNVSQEVAQKVVRAAHHAWEEQAQNVPEDSINLLKLISEPLLMELHFDMYKSALQVHPFFKNYIDLNPIAMQRVCHTAITVLPMSTGDILFTEWEVPQTRRMFFIQSGQLEYTTIKNSHIVSNSEWISEPCLWTADWVHVGTLQALTNCRLLELDAVKFEAIVSSFSSDHVQMYAHGFLELVNKHEFWTDLGQHTPELHKLVTRLFPHSLRTFSR